MDLEQRRRLMRNWRGRRYLTCRAADDLYDLIAALGVDDGSELPPDDGAPAPPSEAIINELQNMATTLKRLILLHNDGRVSPAKLQRF